MKKSSTLAYIVAIMMVFTLLAPVFNAPAVQAAGIPEVVGEMNKIIPYLDQDEKAAIGAARDALGEISSGDWDTVLGIGTDNNLLTDAVIAKFDGETDDAKKAAAKAALIQVGIDLGYIYYSQDTAVLEEDLTKFKNDHRATFRKLFGSTTTVDDLYRLLDATRKQLPTVIQANSGEFVDPLAFGSNTDLVETIPNVLNAAMQNALNQEEFANFRGKLEDIGWSTGKLINQQKKLGNIIDSSQAARLGLAKAMVRSETQLGENSSTTFAVGDLIRPTILIMGKDATPYVEWQSSNPSVVEVTTDEQTSNYILTAKGTGTATLTAFRDVDTANPAAPSDWIFKYEVTVAAAVTPPPSPGGGGGGGGVPKAPEKVIVAGSSVDKETSTVDGKTVETFTVKTDITKQISDAKAKGADTVDIRIPASNTATTVINVPNKVLKSAEGMNVRISCRNMSLELPKALVDAMAKSGQDLNITIDRGTVTEANAQLGGVKGAEGAKVLGTPTHIDTAIKGKTTVTLPLEGIDIPTEPAAQKAFLDSLAILAVHGDKSKDLIQGTIVYENNKPVGIKFTVDRFSMFAIIKLADKVVEPVVTLTDIAGHWAQADIQKLFEAGAISGYPDKSFKPNNNITRAEFAVTLVKALNLAPQSGKVFNDTANHWAKDFIATAQAYGIISGYSDTEFGPNDKITREQMAVMVVKAADLTATDNAKTFTDSAKVSAWAKDAVIAASSNGIISGYPDGSFKPQANATRAEAVTIIVKIL